MHELPLRMDERECPVDGEVEGELLDADEHQRSDLAGPPRHRQDQPRHDSGERAGEDDPADRLPLACATGIRPLAHRVGNRRKRLLGRHDHHRQRQQRERQRGPEETAGAEGRLPVGDQRRAEEELVDRATEDVAEESQPEGSVDDARHAGEIVDGDADGGRQRPARRILAEIEGGENPERRDEEGHDERHRDRPPDRRENTTGAVGLARVVAEEFPPPRHVDAEAFPEGEPIGLPGPDDLGQRQEDRLPRGGGELEAPAFVPGPQFGGPSVERALLGLDRRGHALLRLDRRGPGR